MGAFSGVNPGNEPRADGYLRGQVWNRPNSVASEYLCFRVIHSSINSGFDDWLRTIAYYLLGDPITGENYVLPPGDRGSNFRRIDEPGYYSEQDPLSAASFVLSGWASQQSSAYSPRIRYRDLVLYGSTDRTYYYDAYRPDLWWAKEGGIVRVQGYDSLPSTLQVGDPAALEAGWIISNIKYDDDRRAIDLYLDLSTLGNYKYYAIEFSSEVGFYDAINSRPALLNRILSISASSASSFSALNEWDLYPSYSVAELAAVQSEVVQSGTDSPRRYSTIDKFASAWIFIYDVIKRSGYWVPPADSVSYFGF